MCFNSGDKAVTYRNNEFLWWFCVLIAALKNCITKGYLKENAWFKCMTYYIECTFIVWLFVTRSPEGHGKGLSTVQCWRLSGYCSGATGAFWITWENKSAWNGPFLWSKRWFVNHLNQCTVDGHRRHKSWSCNSNIRDAIFPTFFQDILHFSNFELK